ncbi:zinc finger Ran-binding domain-containing protein 2-like [Palaemon carinicauda]|uniref:zinc finger Ran-binding domain-containing protein 2-like n=1 Tax=Palaemon carinicauda TaxID=392227 RepID=UPI0035B60095
MLDSLKKITRDKKMEKKTKGAGDAATTPGKATAVDPKSSSTSSSRRGSSGQMQKRQVCHSFSMLDSLKIIRDKKMEKKLKEPEMQQQQQKKQQQKHQGKLQSRRCSSSTRKSNSSNNKSRRRSGSCNSSRRGSSNRRNKRRYARLPEKRYTEIKTRAGEAEKLKEPEIQQQHQKKQQQ